MNTLGLVLVSPDDVQRRVLGKVVEQHQATIVREFAAYPSFNNLVSLTELACDAVLVDIDTDIPAALELVENISHNSAITVMVYSRSEDPDLLVRCMRAGAREFVPHAGFAAVLGEALSRTLARRSEVGERKKTRGKVLVFWGAKGGVGVSTLASNFAIALQKEAKRQVALVDLNPHLGQVAVLLGITPRFTLLDALSNGSRLDRDFLTTLMTEHASGLMVLASTDEYMPSTPVPEGTISRMMHLLREQYAYVVVDAGPALGHSTEALLDAADTVYVVTQLDIPSLRNAQRFITYRQREGGQSLEVVLNRFELRKLEFDEPRITKALGLAPRWKVPNDYAGVRRAQNTGAPLAMGHSPVSKGLFQMARAACGKPLEIEKRKKFRLLGFTF